MNKIFLLTDKDELEKFLKEFPKASYYIDKWKFNYKYSILSKKEGAQKARFKKKEKTLRKLATALCVLKEQDKNLSAYNLAKVANADWRTAKKFLEKYNDLINEPVEKIQEIFFLKKV